MRIYVKASVFLFAEVKADTVPEAEQVALQSAEALLHYLSHHEVEAGVLVEDFTITEVN